MVRIAYHKEPCILTGKCAAVLIAAALIRGVWVLVDAFRECQCSSEHNLATARRQSKPGESDTALSGCHRSEWETPRYRHERIVPPSLLYDSSPLLSDDEWFLLLRLERSEVRFLMLRTDVSVTDRALSSSSADTKSAQKRAFVSSVTQAC